MPIEKNDMIPYLEAGLKASSLRSKAIANNIANLQTEGYRRLDVKFEDVLKSRLSKGEPLELEGVEPRLLRPMTTPVAGNGNDVDVDSEIAAMIKNNSRMKLYLKMLRKNYQQMQAAMQVEGGS
ncbi:MAG: flagellar basal body rod protein FlgB [Phycisphaerae bacterium]